MDILFPILIFVIVFLLFSICGFCCKRKREGTVYGLPGTQITVTRQPISATPVVVPPYPVEPRHPTPAAPTHGIGFATHNPPYPTHVPHPTPAPYYYPPPVGGVPYPNISTPYPPAGGVPYQDYSTQPPSYSEAVGQPPAQPPLPPKEGYIPQAPYNLHY